MPDNDITCRYVFTPAENRRAMIGYWGTNRLLFPLLGLMILCFGVALFAPGNTSGPTTSLSNSTLNMLVGVLFVGVILYLGFGSKLRSFRKKPACDKEFFYFIGEDTLRLENPLAKSEVKWEVFRQVIENKNGFLLFYQGSNNFHWLPKSGFTNSDSIRQGRELLRRCVKNSKRLFAAGN